jgi:hypothetical protein
LRRLRGSSFHKPDFRLGTTAASGDVSLKKRAGSFAAALRLLHFSVRAGIGWLGEALELLLRLIAFVFGYDFHAPEERGTALSSVVKGVSNGRCVRRLGPPRARPACLEGDYPHPRSTASAFAEPSAVLQRGLFFREQNVAESNSRRSFRHAAARWRLVSLEAQVGLAARF